jgi:hypothetical protein
MQCTPTNYRIYQCEANFVVPKNSPTSTGRDVHMTPYPRPMRAVTMVNLSIDSMLMDKRHPDSTSPAAKSGQMSRFNLKTLQQRSEAIPDKIRPKKEPMEMSPTWRDCIFIGKSVGGIKAMTIAPTLLMYMSPTPMTQNIEIARRIASGSVNKRFRVDSEEGDE